MQPLAQPDLRDKQKSFYPVSDTGRAADPSLPQVQGGSSSEERSDYRSVVAVLNTDWRVIACGAGIQWILQRRRGRRAGRERWESRSCCRSKAVLLSRINDLYVAVGPAALLVLALLPNWIEAGR